MVQVYAPTNDSNREVKVEFFARLQETVGSVARGDVLIVMGDLNARVGNDTEVWEEILGKHGEVACNENGGRLLQFCNENNLVVSNSWFQHKRIHQFTWECRGRGLKSIIDYFLVRKEHMKRVRDVKVVRGAEVGSDHYLVLMKIQLRLVERKEATRNVRKERIKVEKLKSVEIRRAYQIGMAKRCGEVNHAIQGGSVEEVWKVVKECMLGAATGACGIAKRRNVVKKRTRWWNDEVQSAVRRKKLLYKKMLDVGTDEARERYSEAKLEAKRVVRKAKNEEWVQLGRELEKEAVNNQRKFWRRVNEHRRSKGGGVHINGEDGQLLTDQTEVMDRWKEHFESLFQEDEGGSEQPDLELSQENDKGISEEEVRRAVSRLKGGKAPGTCGIMPEMLKAGGEVAIEWLVKLFNVVWERGVAPRDWKTAIIVPIHKKGSRLECTNYRGISLLSVVGKVFARVLNDRVKGLTEGSVMDEQGGFRSGRGCIDQVFAVKQVIEKMIEKDRVMFMVFIDLEKAYDNVCREKLWRVLSEYGVRGRLLRSIKALYEGGRARVKVEGMESQGFRVRKGVRQGCTLSPWLFNVFIDKVVKEARRECVREVTLSTGSIGILMFADDMVMMAETKEALQHNVEAMNEALSRWDLRVNWKKSKVMRVARKREECQVVIGDEQLEQVDTMKYLGVMISGDGSMEREVEARIGCASRVIGGMSQAILRRRELSKQTKLKVVNATVMPVLMYGCETWAVRKEQKSKIQATQMNILRRIEGVCWKDRITNDEILQRLGQVGVLEMVRKRQEEWKGRLEGMDNERCTKRAFEGVVEGRRPRGRPRLRWLDNFR